MKKLLLAITCFFIAITLHAQGLPDTQIKDVNSGKKLPFNESIEKEKLL